MPSIYICSIGSINKSYIDSVSMEIEDVFDISSKIIKTSINPEIAFDYSREQYHSTRILKEILNEKAENTLKLIGVVDVDLFVPVLTFVFGEAQLNGDAAIISITRLKNEFYGLPKNEKLLIERIVKEIVHELGHTFGLYHCQNYECVMSSSMYVENIDLKNKQFCKTCKQLLGEKVIGTK